MRRTATLLTVYQLLTVILIDKKYLPCPIYLHFFTYFFIFFPISDWTIHAIKFYNIGDSKKFNAICNLLITEHLYSMVCAK